MGSRPYQRQGGENGKSPSSRELWRRAFPLYNLIPDIMIVSLVRASVPTVLEREFVLHAIRTEVTSTRISVCVDEFFEFLHYLYHAYASLSRKSHGEAMRMTIICEVNGRKFFVRVEDGGLRYGEV